MSADDRHIPDTGFKLRPLIQSVLRESTATDLDDLALEILAQIPAYDRDTALFQAVRALARETWRPAFIPTPKDTAPETEQPVTPHNPPPERDGRQWLTTDGQILDSPEDVASTIEAEASHIEADEKAAGASDEQAAAAAGEAAEAAWEQAKAQLPPARPSSRVQSTTPARPPMRSAVPPPKPKTSPKVAAIREAWQRALTQRIATEQGHKFLRDCTVIDLEYAATQREQHAERVLARAADLRTLANVMRTHNARVLSEVPTDVLAAMSDTLAEAAA